MSVSLFPSEWRILPDIKDDRFWEEYLGCGSTEPSSFAVHLAVLREPYLSLILSGEKTLESRFSTHRMLPYGRVTKGDVVLLKRSGGPILGVAYIAQVWFYEILTDNELIMSRIRTQYAGDLCIRDIQFWESRSTASYVTLMRFEHVRTLATPIRVMKRDQRAWVILEASSQVML